MDRAVAPSLDRAPVPKGIPPERIADVLKREHPQVIALILSRMDSGTAAGALSALPAELRDDVAYRLATLEDGTPDGLRDLDENLSQELQSLVTGSTDVKGTERAAAILNMAGGSLEQSVMRRLEAEDPKLAELDIAKQRNGPTGTVKLHFEGRYARFENRSDLPDGGAPRGGGFVGPLDGGFAVDDSDDGGSDDDEPPF